MNSILKLIVTYHLLILSICVSTAHAGDAFPFRGNYSDVPVIELAELSNGSADYFIVDVRSKLEYDVIHIANAVNIPVSNRGFEKLVAKQRPANKKIITYCNGHTCKKSYKAARRLMKAGLNEVYAFDAGIFDWTQANPDKSTLLGESPANLNNLVPKSTFAEHTLNSKEFFTRQKDENSFLIDVRESFQRTNGDTLKGARSIPVDRLHKWLAAGNKKDKVLFIVDAVGKQVRWLQYYLIKYNYENYYFLKGGAEKI